MTETPSHACRPSLLQPRLWPSWLILAIAVLAARLPWCIQRLLGRIVGWLAMHLSASRRKAAQVNLELCFPQKSQQWRQTLLQDSFIDLGIGLFEFIRAWWGTTKPMRNDVQIEGIEHLQTLQAQGRGVLLISGHFMTLEMCGRLMCDHIKLAGMYRRHRNPVTEWAIKRGRLRYASAMFTNNDIRAAVRHLKRGGFLWYAPDQDMRGKDTVFVPFFGMPASTITATHQLARLTGCAVVPFYHRRQGGRYYLQVMPPIENFPTEDATADTTRVNEQIEAMVKQAPSQYLWVHRRFKRQPEQHDKYFFYR